MPHPDPSSRPPTRRTLRLTFRATAAEARTIRANARATGLSVSAYVRALAFGRPIKARRSHLQRDARYQLSKIGNNLNQLLRVARDAGQGELARLLDSVLQSPAGRPRPARWPGPESGPGPVIGEIRSGSSFAGLTHYVLHGSAATHAKTPEWVELRGLLTTDPDRAYLEMEATAAQNPRVERPVFHVVLSPAPGDELGREQWRALADRVLGDLGLGEHQVLVALHTDTEHPHLHLAVNRVHPQTLRAWETWRSKTRLEEVLRKVEREWGLRVVPGRLAEAERSSAGREAPAALTPGEQAQLHQRATEPQVVAWRRDLRGAFEEARSWTDLAGRLQVNGVHLVARGRGMVLSDGKVFVKLSRLDREWSRGRLEARFGQGFAEWRREVKQFETAAKVYPRYAARAPHHPRARAAVTTLRRTGRTIGWRALRQLSGPFSPAVASLAMAARLGRQAAARSASAGRADWERFAAQYLGPAIERAGSWAEAESRLAFYGAWLAPAEGSSRELVVSDGRHSVPSGRLGPGAGRDQLEERLGSWDDWQRSRRELLAVARRVESTSRPSPRLDERYGRLVRLIQISEQRIALHKELTRKYESARWEVRQLLGNEARLDPAVERWVLKALWSRSSGTVEEVLAAGKRSRTLGRMRRSRPSPALVEAAKRYRELAGQVGRAAPPARSAVRRLKRLRYQARLTDRHSLHYQSRDRLADLARPLLASGLRSLVARAVPGIGAVKIALRILSRLQRGLSRGEEMER